MRILGFDPALSITGYGVIDIFQGKFSLIEAGVIQTRAHQDLASRLVKIYQAAAKLISDTRPQIVVLEKVYAHYRHPVTAYILGQARGVIYLAAANKNIPVAEYAATRIKKAIVGNGLASKYQVQRMVGNILGLGDLPKYTDVTDALALAIAYPYIHRDKK